MFTRFKQLRRAIGIAQLQRVTKHQTNAVVLTTNSACAITSTHRCTSPRAIMIAFNNKRSSNVACLASVSVGDQCVKPANQMKKRCGKQCPTTFRQLPHNVCCDNPSVVLCVFHQRRGQRQHFRHAVRKTQAFEHALVQRDVWRDIEFTSNMTKELERKKESELNK